MVVQSFNTNLTLNVNEFKDDDVQCSPVGCELNRTSFNTDSILGGDAEVHIPGD